MRKWITLCESVEVTYSVTENEFVKNNFTVAAHVNGTQIGYATFKKARNKYISGKNIYRIGNYTIFQSDYRGQGIANGMIDYFENLGNIVIPSGLFGAAGKLTQDGFKAAKARLTRNPPTWLPDDWEGELDSAKMV